MSDSADDSLVVLRTSTSSPTMTASPDAALAAVERRLQSVPHQPSAAQLAAEHDKRQKMRRMIGALWRAPAPASHADLSVK